MSENVLPIVISAMVALLVLLGFINVMINSKKSGLPIQSLDCKYQHEVINSKMSRTDANIEKITGHLAEIAVILRDQSKTSERFHGELLGAIKDRRN